MLTVQDKIALVGPNETINVDIKSRSDGIYCCNEEDGLRVMTSEQTYFLELVNEATILTFGLA